MREQLRRTLPALAGLVIFAVALLVLRRELRALTWPVLIADVLVTPLANLGAAILLTFCNYAVLTGYDFIALAYIGKSLARWRTAVASFVAYAVANNVGFAMLSGASVRYRFYSRWGVTAEELSRIVFSYSVTFWLGLLTLGGLSLAVGPLPRAHGLPALAPVGWLLAAAGPAYLVFTLIRHEPLRWRNLQLPLPRPRLALAQLAISLADWTLAGAVLYALLPASGASFWAVLGAFLAAQILGLASHVPGGVGVFEGLMVLLLSPFLRPSQLLPPLIVYRVVYYLLPLCIALVVLLVDEARQRRSLAARTSAYLGRLSEQLTPRVLAVFTFLGGLVLLFSGATPAAAGRLAMLNRVVPLGIVESSHFIGSVAGAVLLLLSHSLARRLDAAYYLTGLTVSVGIVASLLKGADYEEAVLLALLLLALRLARHEFDRKAALFETRFSPSWIAAVLAALGSSVWLGLFAFKHVEYSGDLWWQFALQAQVSRFLRGSVGAATVVFLFAVARLIGRAPHEAEEPSDADLEAVRPIIAAQSSALAYLVYLRDKSILFDAERKAFLMYAVQRRTWVALRDPVGPADRAPGLIRAFLERCDDYGGTPAFYEVSKACLHHYADFGLAFVKLGEEARVNLRRFSLEGGESARFRQALRRPEKHGAAIRLAPVEEVPALLDQLELVSDDWLDQKSGSEKGFSLGFFDRAYLSRFPVAIVEREGRVLAFASLWPGPQKEELSVDLMRYHRDAPKDIMESLFVYLMKWGKEQGYNWFALGMAPLSGFEQSPVAAFWTRLGVFLYEHGDVIYNFQGLRAYKDKFNPVWEPRYLAYPGGLTLPRVLADAAALVAGGYRHIFVK
jgi:phosphatidylglycerol lysyltransferase